MLKQRRSNIDIVLLAPLAAINDSCLDGTASTLDMDFLATERVVVGVRATRLTVKHNMGDGGDAVRVDVPLAASSETGIEPGEVPE